VKFFCETRRKLEDTVGRADPVGWHGLICFGFDLGKRLSNVMR